MARALYSLKIFLFRNQYKLNEIEKKRLAEICVFIIHVYVKAWLNCTSAIKAPYQDFLFAQKLEIYDDEQISTVALKKFQNNLWYLYDETVALAFFDDSVSLANKRKMIESLNNNISF